MSFLLGGLENFSVVTDHRPLIGVFNKALSTVDNPRLVRIREKASAYSLEVSWLAGKHNVIADALSAVFACVIGASSLVSELHKGASSCDSYRLVYEAFQSGLDPMHLPISHPACQLQKVWDEMSVVDGKLLCIGSQRIFIPMNCRKMILDKLHEVHPGITRMYKTARHHYFWPGLKNDIVNLINGCDACQHHQASQPSDVHIATIASAPMEQTSSDLFQIGNVHYLLLIDRFSKFPLVARLSSLSSKAIINKLRSWFMLFGFPRTIRTDGGLQFRTDFRKFCEKFAVIHQLSSPYNPSSNGSAEAGMKVVKTALVKMTPSMFDDTLSAIRNTCSSDGKIPSNLFFSRVVRTATPVFDSVQPLTEQSPQPHNLDKLRALAVGTMYVCRIRNLSSVMSLAKSS